MFRRQRGNGQGMVEFAMVAPIFFALVFGIVAAGWLFFQSAAVSDGAQGGAREAIVETNVSTMVAGKECESSLPRSIEAAVQQAANAVTVDPNPLCQEGSSGTTTSFCPEGQAATLVQTPVTGDAMVQICVIGGLTGPTAYKVQVRLVAHPLAPLLGAAVDLTSTSTLAVPAAS